MWRDGERWVSENDADGQKHINESESGSDSDNLSNRERWHGQEDRSTAKRSERKRCSWALRADRWSLLRRASRADYVCCLSPPTARSRSRRAPQSGGAEGRVCAGECAPAIESSARLRRRCAVTWRSRRARRQRQPTPRVPPAAKR